MFEFLRSDLSKLAAYTPHTTADLTTDAHPTSESLVDPKTCPTFDQLDTNEFPDDLPTDLKEKLFWTYQQVILANRYPDGGHLALKQAIATYVQLPWLGQSSTSADLISSTEPHIQGITPEQIAMGNGSDELIRSILIATCVGRAGRILVAQPTFSMYRILAETLGVAVSTIGRSPETFEVDLSQAQQVMDQPQQPPVRVVFMVHPNSPTGNALTAAELDWLRQISTSVLVVVDEAYFEFSGQTLLGELAQRPNWLILRTFSKAFRLAAHRIGYGIGHPEVIQTLEKVRLPYNLPSVSQAAAQLAIAYRDQLLAAVPDLLQARDQMYAWLKSQTTLQVWPSAANFLFVRLQPAATPLSLEQIHQHLWDLGTHVRLTGGGLRITIGTPAENQRTCKHLQTILSRPK